MAVHTKLSKSDINKILRNYNIGQLKSFSGIKDGIENTNYKLETSYKNYVITIYEDRVKKKNLPFFLNLMLNCKKAEINCPEPVHDINGKLINSFKRKKLSIFSFLNGASKKKWMKNHCFEVGKILALFHKANKRNKIHIPNDFSLAFWKSLFYKISKKDLERIIPGSSSVLTNEINFIEKNWPESLPSGIIHADLFPDNVFFFKSKISGILDFYFSCHDFLLYDLAVTVNAWCFINGKYVKKNFDNLIEGYKTIRNLNKNEKKNFNVMLRGASLRFLLTRIYDSINRKESKFIKKKDPKEFFSILNFHILLEKGFNYFNKL